MQVPWTSFEFACVYGLKQAHTHIIPTFYRFHETNADWAPEAEDAAAEAAAALPAQQSTLV